ncbi:hypothetical protein [Actinophytocola sp.]|uniref:hypothetical protein n=1 Tax=Actinophytocola sp. TaxID=1872138 RepID=UPI003899E52D
MADNDQALSKLSAGTNQPESAEKKAKDAGGQPPQPARHSHQARPGRSRRAARGGAVRRTVLGRAVADRPSPATRTPP